MEARRRRLKYSVKLIATRQVGHTSVSSLDVTSIAESQSDVPVKLEAITSCVPVNLEVDTTIETSALAAIRSDYVVKCDVKPVEETCIENLTTTVCNTDTKIVRVPQTDANNCPRVDSWSTDKRT